MTRKPTRRETGGLLRFGCGNRTTVETHDARRGDLPGVIRFIETRRSLVVLLVLPRAAAAEGAADLDRGAVLAVVRDRREDGGHLGRGLEFVEGQLDVFLVLAARLGDLHVLGDLEGLLFALLAPLGAAGRDGDRAVF